MEPFLVRLQPLSESPTARSTHDGEEFLYVLSGKVTVCLGNLSDVLEEGDSIYYNSTIPITSIRRTNGRRSSSR